MRADLRKKNRNPKWSVIGEVDPAIGDLYRWWIKRLWWLDLDPPKWYPHTTVLDGRNPIKQDKFWKQYHKKTIEIEYSPVVEQHWKFFVVPVRCKIFDEIRYNCGFDEVYPYHITIGRMK